MEGRKLERESTSENIGNEKKILITNTVQN